MKDYKDYAADDFIGNDSFIHWVKFPSDHDGFWPAFIAENPDKKQEIEEAIRFLKLFGDQQAALPPDKLFRLHQQINERLDVPVSASAVHQIVKSRSQRTRVYSYAAVITIALLAFSSWWLFSRNSADALVKSVTVPKAVMADNHLQEHVTPKGERSLITLEDGTQVWINADSKLEYSQDFLKGSTRDVYLQGEAYFDVTSDKSRPFIVHVQGVDIKVLGTSFNVKGYHGEHKIEATLVHGKISLSGASSDNVTLAANQRFVFLTEKKKLMVENNVETDTYTSWRKGVLVFDDQPLYEILPILERTFNVTIHTDQATSLDCRFTAKINNMSLAEVLELFGTSDTIGYTIFANDVYITGSFCDD
jgi:transmembrane sensor